MGVEDARVLLFELCKWLGLGLEKLQENGTFESLRNLVAYTNCIFAIPNTHALD